MPAAALFHLDPLFRLALAEDLACGDLTSDNLPLAVQQQLSQLVVVPRQPCVVSGLAVGPVLCALLDSALCWQPLVDDSSAVVSGQPIARLSGPLGSVLKLERTLLNFLQHLGGVATHTAQFVKAVEGTGARIVHTRKTTPGLRFLEVQAVVDGGGYPHRYHLGQAAMVKDNHWQASGLPLDQCAAHIKARLSHAAKFIVEVESVDQIEGVIAAGADVLLLDNFTVDQVRQAVVLIGSRPVVIEVSGGITLHTAAAYAQAGAHILSTSAITLGAPPIDLGLDVVANHTITPSLS
jgi:nicotinate-nucleotide pyrophosphorylase (carboxylating)